MDTILAQILPEQWFALKVNKFYNTKSSYSQNDIWKGVHIYLNLKKVFI